MPFKDVALQWGAGWRLNLGPQSRAQEGLGAESLWGGSRSDIVQRGVGLHLGGLSELSAQAVHTMPGTSCKVPPVALPEVGRKSGDACVGLSWRAGRMLWTQGCLWQPQQNHECRAVPATRGRVPDPPRPPVTRTF